jgi:uncharacterized metal-binding protein/uncharacterized protein (DUF2249 family)
MSRLSPKDVPLVYSCSGSSSAAQLANHVAVQLDRRELAEMSCIAGVGGDVEPLVHEARSGRPLVAIDGCPLRCVKHTLARHGLAPTLEFELSQHGVKRRKHVDFEPAEATEVLGRVSARLEQWRSEREGALFALPQGSGAGAGATGSRGHKQERRMDRELDLRTHTLSCAEASTQAFDGLAVGNGVVLVADHDPTALRYFFEAERRGQFTWEPLVNGVEGVWRVRLRRTAAG